MGDGIHYEEKKTVFNPCMDADEFQKLFKLIVANPGYGIKVFCQDVQCHIAVPNHIFDWDDFSMFANFFDFKVYLK
jgi:hypothetical protein